MVKFIITVLLWRFCNLTKDYFEWVLVLFEFYFVRCDKMTKNFVTEKHKHMTIYSIILMRFLCSFSCIQIELFVFNRDQWKVQGKPGEVEKLILSQCDMYRMFPECGIWPCHFVSNNETP